VRQTPNLTKCAPQKVFDLGIEAAQFIPRPVFERGICCRVEPQKKWFALRHGLVLTRIERAGVDHGLRTPLPAQDNEQIAHHRRAALGI
jgi:hypothetical protein